MCRKKSLYKKTSRTTGWKRGSKGRGTKRSRTPGDFSLQESIGKAGLWGDATGLDQQGGAPGGGLGRIRAIHREITRRGTKDVPEIRRMKSNSNSALGENPSRVAGANGPKPKLVKGLTVFRADWGGMVAITFYLRRRR